MLGIFERIDDHTAKLSKSSKNIALADIMFKYVAEYGFMHSSYFMTTTIMKALKVNLPSIGEYLDSRLQECGHSFEKKT